VITTTATALKVLPIAAQHPTQLYVAGSLAILGLGALAVSYAAITTLASHNRSRPRTRQQHVKASWLAPAGTIFLPGGEQTQRGPQPARHYQAMAAKPVTPGNGVNVSPFITPTRPPPVVSLVPIAIWPVELTQYREMPMGALPSKWTRPRT
jgi:hypothetical protein